jgi:hypothetical protein
MLEALDYVLSPARSLQTLPSASSGRHEYKFIRDDVWDEGPNQEIFIHGEEVWNLF